jgi:hypothetical protein
MFTNNIVDKQLLLFINLLYMRTKTNVLYLSNCKRVPPKWWWCLFQQNKEENAFISVDELFKEFKEEYEWLYKYTDIDYIGWQIEHGQFDWTTYSWAVAQYCPENFNADLYNWEQHSYLVARHCPKHFDSERFNWKKDGWAVAIHCPQFFDPTKFNWDKDGWILEKYRPEFLKLKP